MKFERRAENPEMEEVLYREYKELRSKGLKVKAWWFQLWAKQILHKLQPQATFFFCCLKKRHSISKRRATNMCQKEPTDKCTAIQQFHQLIRRTAREGNQVGQLGQWTLSNIANMDQTPLPFTFSDGETYADKGDHSVWVRGGASDLEKRQCTVQLTIFADGETRVKPLVLFRGKEKRNTLVELARYDKRVFVKFQPNAWCDEYIMKFWVTYCWKSFGKRRMHLILDVHRAKKTEAIQKMLEEDCRTSITYVPGGCTSLV